MRRNWGGSCLVWRTRAAAGEPPAEMWRLSAATPAAEDGSTCQELIILFHQGSQSEMHLWDRKGDISTPHNCCRNEFNATCHMVSVSSTSLGSSSTPSNPLYPLRKHTALPSLLSNVFGTGSQNHQGILMLISEILILLVCSMAETSALKKKKFQVTLVCISKNNCWLILSVWPIG